jgi:hypothetical protein
MEKANALEAEFPATRFAFMLITRNGWPLDALLRFRQVVTIRIAQPLCKLVFLFEHGWKEGRGKFRTHSRFPCLP